MAATIRAVAAAAGVSITTVSFVLNNKHPQVDAIPKETRDRVKACAAALGYRRNPAAATLRTGRSLWVGVMVQSLVDETDAWMWAPYELCLLSGIQKTFSEHGYFTVVGSEPQSDAVDNLEGLISSGIGGLIMRNPTPRAVAKAQELINEGTPVIAVFPQTKDDLYPYSIDVDNYSAGQLAGKLVLEAGRKKFLTMTYDWFWHVDNERVKGFTDEIANSGGATPIHVPVAKKTDAEILDFLVPVLEKERPDAVMCTNAGNTLLTSIAASRIGISVPDEMMIIGFDCSSFRGARNQRLSAIGTSWWEAGQLAASSILELTQSRETWQGPKALEPRFIPGDTTPAGLGDGPSPWWLL